MPPHAESNDSNSHNMSTKVSPTKENTETDKAADPSEKEEVNEGSKTLDLEEKSATEPSKEDDIKSPTKKDSSKKKEAKFTYRDYSHIEATHAPPGVSPTSSAIRVQKLPAKLNAMLSNPEYHHIISWMPHGRSWKVHNPHAFVEDVIPKYFEYTNYNSFVRLVNAWGFRRITKGPDRNSYYHELFLRAMPHLHAKMHRLTANEKKLPVDPEDEPDFYKISALCPLPTVSHIPGASAMAKSSAMSPGLPSSNAHSTQLQKQMGAAGMGGLGMGMGGLGGAGMMGTAAMMGTRYPGMGGINPMMEDEMAMAGMPGASYGQMNASLQQQRAELIAANQAVELQAARLREQERRLAYLQGAANPAAASVGAGGLGGSMGYPAQMGRLGRGIGMPNAMGMFPDDMLSDPTGSLEQRMMARLQQGQQVPKQPYQRF